ncbi:hypothetical protein CY34DRAFT_97721 [Suillus luteus UH-Slu-Lm8-n1]|uniref:Uncharacterized protein n=1 Tax=Suillus luteus UH-Slu-Lm8-n1 TaxID=930992 RepID=A0A0C9ZAM6_9AGAM|nr:hypothetical protein CY34DRAFT_97721 [Suillus luteus UH-Slu-Lm8-n1]
METTDQVDTILEAFDIVGISPSEFIIKLLNDPHYINHKTVINLRESGQYLAELLVVQSDVVQGRYVCEVQTLSAKESGYHFLVLITCVEQLEEFDIGVLGRGMALHAPFLWKLLDILLSARGKGHLSSGDLPNGGCDVDEDDEALWEELVDLDLEEIVDGLEGDMSKKKNRIIAHQNKLITIVSLMTANKQNAS